jgi:translation elongation factor P/translation initiation factor 5A
MLIKIGNKLYDPNIQPVMVILTDKDKENIALMDSEAHKYCAYPEGMNAEEILKWMEEECPSA